MPPQTLTEQQALFIAGLPRNFSTLSDAINSHAFVQRVAPLSIDSANASITSSLRLGFAEQDDRGNVRLVQALVTERDGLVESEGSAEVAEYELALMLLQRQ